MRFLLPFSNLRYHSNTTQTNQTPYFSKIADLKELDDHRSLILSDIRGKEQRLAQVPLRIESLKNAAQPLLDLLGMGKRLGRAEFDVQHRLDHLPRELKPLHVQLEVYNKLLAGSEDASAVEIGCEGSVDEAGKFVVGSTAVLEEEPEFEDAEEDENEEAPDDEDRPAPATIVPAVMTTAGGDLDGEDETVEGPAPPPKPLTQASHRRSAHDRLSTSIAERVERKRAALLSAHPISLTATIAVGKEAGKGKGSPGMRLVLVFSYAPQLQCVGVRCRLEGGGSGVGDGMKGLLEASTLLDELFDGDTGERCPSVVGRSLLEMFG